MTLCPYCLSKNVIATVNGPTCAHHDFGSNAAWFPEWWTPKADEADGFDRQRRRMEHLEKLNAIQPAPLEFEFS